MITYTKNGVNIAEVFFDEPAQPPRVDVVRYQQTCKRRSGTAVEEFHTLEIDLTPSEEEIFGQMHGSRRYHLRRALKESLTYEYTVGDLNWLEEFLSFWADFAATKHLQPANRARLTSLCRAGMLDLSRMRDEDGQVLVWHVFMRANGRARGIHSPSIYRGLESRERNLVASANLCLHWKDMLRFKSEGCRVYDLGGWYAGQTDEDLLSVNRFKEGFGGRIVCCYNINTGRTLKGMAAVYAREALMAWRSRR